MNIEERKTYVMEMNEAEFEAFEYVLDGVIDDFGYRVVGEKYIITMDEDMYDRAEDAMERFVAEINTKIDWFDEEPSEEDWLAYEWIKDMLNDIYYDLR